MNISKALSVICFLFFYTTALFGQSKAEKGILKV